MLPLLVVETINRLPPGCSARACGLGSAFWKIGVQGRQELLARWIQYSEPHAQLLCSFGFQAGGIEGMEKHRDTSEFADLADKIARLVQERGWSQEEFAHQIIERANA